jgi:hypothetical protein
MVKFAGRAIFTRAKRYEMVAVDALVFLLRRFRRSWLVALGAICSPGVQSFFLLFLLLLCLPRLLFREERQSLFLLRSLLCLLLLGLLTLLPFCPLLGVVKRL